MEIIRGRLSSAALIPPNTRWDTTCDCIQMTPDDGTTWIDTPENDPRHGAGFRLPASTEPDIRCDAAERMTRAMNRYVDTVIDAASIIEAVNGVLAIILVVLPGAGILIDLFIAGVTGLFGIGLTAINLAMTDPVYEQIFCIIYCNIGADGQMSAEQLGDITDDITAQIGGIPEQVWRVYSGALGEVGLSNAGVIGGETGDCDDCDCGWCHTEEVSISATVDSYGCYAGTCYVTLLYFQFNMPTTATITHLEVEAEYTCGSAAGDLAYKSRILVTSGVDQSGAVLYNPQYDQANCDGNSPSTNVHFSIDGARYLQWLMVLGSHNNGSGTADGSGTITRWTIHGTGDNPYGDDNC